MPLHAHLNESSNEISNSHHTLQTMSFCAIKKSENPAFTNQEEFGDSRLLDESIIENNKCRRKQSMPNLAFNRESSKLTNVNKRKFSLGQIKVF